jgi:hypothetical protein
LQEILQEERRSVILKEYSVLQERLDAGDPAMQVAEHIIASIQARG